MVFPFDHIFFFILTHSGTNYTQRMIRLY